MTYLTERISALIAIAATTSVLLAACADRLPTDYADDAIMPLAIGNRWIGKVEEFDENGLQTGEYFDTILIVDKDGDHFLDQHRKAYWYENDTLYWDRSGGSSGSEECRCPRAVYPATEGTLFGFLPGASVLIQGSNGQPEVVTESIASVVASDDTLITVPAGSYRAYHYHPRILSPLDAEFIEERHDFFTPEIGPVRIETYHGSQLHDTIAKRWELVEARIQ